jgi:hypothetical protein
MLIIITIDQVTEVQLRTYYLAAEVSVGRADNEPVLGCVVLVLVLAHQPLPRIVVSLAFPAPPELDLCERGICYCKINLLM